MKLGVNKKQNMSMVYFYYACMMIKWEKKELSICNF